MNHQWSKGDEFERGFAELVAGALGPELSVFSYLRPRSELWVAERFAELTRYHRAFRSCNRAFHQDPGQRVDRLVRSVRQVLLHRPRPGAVHGPLGPRPTCSAATSPSRTRTTSNASGPWSGWEPTTSPSSAWATSTSAGPPPCSPRGARTGPSTVVLRRLYRRVGRGPAAGGRRRGGAARAARGPPHPGSLCTRRSPGPRSLTRRSASGVWASRDGPASAASRAMGCVPVLVDDAPGAPALDGLEVLATGSGGPRCAASLRRRGQEPGHQPLPPRGGAARGGGGRRVRWPRPLHGGGRSDPCGLHHRDQGQEHDDRAGRAPPHPARLPRPGRRQHRPPALGSLPPSPDPTTGSSRRRASRSPTSTRRPVWSP